MIKYLQKAFVKWLQPENFSLHNQTARASAGKMLNYKLTFNTLNKDIRSIMLFCKYIIIESRLSTGWFCFSHNMKTTGRNNYYLYFHTVVCLTIMCSLFWNLYPTKHDCRINTFCHGSILSEDNMLQHSRDPKIFQNPQLSEPQSDQSCTGFGRTRPDPHRSPIATHMIQRASCQRAASRHFKYQSCTPTHCCLVLLILRLLDTVRWKTRTEKWATQGRGM